MLVQIIWNFTPFRMILLRTDWKLSEYFLCCCCRWTTFPFLVRNKMVQGIFFALLFSTIWLLYVCVCVRCSHRLWQHTVDRLLFIDINLYALEIVILFLIMRFFHCRCENVRVILVQHAPYYSESYMPNCEWERMRKREGWREDIKQKEKWNCCPIHLLYKYTNCASLDQILPFICMR